KTSENTGDPFTTSPASNVRIIGFFQRRYAFRSHASESLYRSPHFFFPALVAVIASITALVITMANSAFRESSYITGKQAEALIDAAGLSWILDRPLNIATTIRIGDQPRAIGVFIDYFSDWNSASGQSPVFIYSKERPPKHPNSLHLHFLA